MLKQGQYAPMDVEDQVLILYTLTRGFLDDIEINKLKRFEKEYLEFIHSTGTDILEELKKTKDISKELEEKIVSITERFKKSFN